MISLINIATIFALVAPALVNGHGRFVNPPSISGRDQRINQNGVDGCGLQNAQAANAYATRAPQTTTVYTPGQIANLQYTITNQDGAGPLTARIDTTATGQAFNTPAQITQNVQGTNGIIARAGTNFPVAASVGVQIPQNIQCTGPGNTCILQARQGAGFGTCIMFRVNPPAPVQQVQQVAALPPANFIGQQQPLFANQQPFGGFQPLAGAQQQQQQAFGAQQFAGAQQQQQVFGAQQFAGGQQQQQQAFAPINQRPAFAPVANARFLPGAVTAQ